MDIVVGSVDSYTYKTNGEHQIPISSQTHSARIESICFIYRRSFMANGLFHSLCYLVHMNACLQENKAANASGWAWFKSMRRYMHIRICISTMHTYLLMYAVISYILQWCRWFLRIKAYTIKSESGFQICRCYWTQSIIIWKDLN